MSSDLVLFERAGSAAIIRLNRENKLNALNRVIFDALAICLDDIARDQTCSVAILTGTGRAFCAGADIGEYWKGDRNAFREFQSRGLVIELKNRAKMELTLLANESHSQ